MTAKRVYLGSGVWGTKRADGEIRPVKRRRWGWKRYRPEALTPSQQQLLEEIIAEVKRLRQRST